LSGCLPSVDIDIAYSFYLEGMLNWFKRKEGTYLNKKNYENFLKHVKERISKLKNKED
jgi:hypothetical protein